MDSDEATTVCKRNALGRVKVPKAQEKALRNEFERSACLAQFARAAGIHGGLGPPYHFAPGSHSMESRFAGVLLQVATWLPGSGYSKNSPS